MPNTDHNTLLYRADADIGNYWGGAVPNIVGIYRVDYGRPTGYSSGAFYHAGGGPEIRGNTAAGNCGVGFDASRVSGIYKDGTTSVHPRSLNIYMVIKYI